MRHRLDKRLHDFRSGDRGDLVSTIILLSASVALVLVAIQVIINLITPDESTGSSAENPEPVESTPATVSFEPIDWSIILYVLLGIGAFVGVTYMIRKIMKALHTRQDMKAETARLQSRWDAVQERYDAVRKAIVRYETDISLAIRYPAMNDPLQYTTSAMLNALKKTEDIVRVAAQHGAFIGKQEHIEEFSEATHALETAFEKAERTAKKLALSKMSEQDQKDLRQAQFLLDHIRDGANPEHLRTQYAQRLQKLLRDINTRNHAAVVPDTTLHVLESQHLLILSAAEEDDVQETLVK